MVLRWKIRRRRSCRGSGVMGKLRGRAEEQVVVVLIGLEKYFDCPNIVLAAWY